MSRVFNYSAGPSMLPVSVLEQCAKEMLEYGDSGMSVMEMSHRSKAYDAIIKEAFATFRRVMGVPDNYKVLFMQGGASTQFAAVPLNLMKNGKADYVVSGEFSGKAYKEAQKYGDVKLLATSEDTNFDRIPTFKKEDVRPDADYVHICYNNTIFGTHFNAIPDTGDVPLVCDMSSCIMSEPINVSRFGMIYAGAQKNIGPAGLTVVIIREDLLGNARPDTPAMLNYKVISDGDSMYNTPPCYAIYVAGLVFQWVEQLGGLYELYEINKMKADILYTALEKTKIFQLHAQKDSRSLMNVTFRTGDADLDKKFIAEAAARGMVSLAGHRKVGGMRASIYNAMPMEGVRELAKFIKEFDEANA
ncbi:MAG: 3-phosphoserine/phosphohydroxythreonine transaminase [Clostridia bacterium]|nr:3-phosphoserine/phosphohydroxythreonine transaminase [Clostridia bacterium]